MSVVEEIPIDDGPSMTSSPQGTRARRWAKLLGTFMTGQLLVQGLGLVTGFLLLRWMTVEAYAQYSIAFAFQSTVNILVDVGFNGCIIALVGARGNDPAVIGGYTRVARTYRGRMFYVIGGLSAVAFPLVVAHQPWGWPTKAALLASILAAVFFDAWDVYRAPLLIHQRLADSYRADAFPAAGRLVLSGLLNSVGGLFGWVAAWFSALMNLASGLMLRKASSNLVHEPDWHDPEIAREALKYLAPLWPGMVFYAFQGQITVALISMFGRTQNIAEVAALGRLGQLFMVLGAFTGVVVVPKIASAPKEKLIRMYLAVLGIAALAASLITLCVFIFPTPFIWLLGEAYRQLGSLVGWSIAGSGIAYLAHTTFAMNTARKWVFWGTSIASPVMLVGFQVAYIVFRGVSTSRDAVFFSLVTSVALLLGVLSTSALGILKFSQAKRIVPTV